MAVVAAAVAVVAAAWVKSAGRPLTAAALRRETEKYASITSPARFVSPVFSSALQIEIIVDSNKPSVVNIY